MPISKALAVIDRKLKTTATKLIVTWDGSSWFLDLLGMRDGERVGCWLQTSAETLECALCDLAADAEKSEALREEAEAEEAEPDDQH